MQQGTCVQEGGVCAGGDVRLQVCALPPHAFNASETEALLALIALLALFLCFQGKPPHLSLFALFALFLCFQGKPPHLSLFALFALFTLLASGCAQAAPPGHAHTTA